MYKMMAIYPPTGQLYQRGEDRCQINIESSSANSLRACNDLGYISSILKQDGYQVLIRDYQAEKQNLKDLISDLKKENPQIVFISTVNACINDDLEVVKKIKEFNSEIIVILKSALFFNCDYTLFDNINFDLVDYLVGGEIEFIISPLVYAHFKNKELLKDIQGICYKNDGSWIVNEVKKFNDSLDSLPFPDRTEMKNELYINPETNRPMALITTSKGCCYSCKYCLSPIISGKKVRERSVDSILLEIEECISKHNIVDFFFKSDTFTLNKKLVIELCEKLVEKGLNEKINWVATARVDTIDDELLMHMKKAGCSLLAIGFEAGSNESLQKMMKKTTIEQNIIASKLCKKNGLKILGYFLIGFPWENKTHLADVKKHVFEVDADYIEISIVVPFLKTPLYEEYIERIGTELNVLGADSYQNIFKGFSQLSSDELQKFRKNTLISFYLRPKYILKKLRQIKNMGIFLNYLKYGFRILKNYFS